MGFMKDGCPMDEDALAETAERSVFVYMDSEDVSFRWRLKIAVKI